MIRDVFPAHRGTAEGNLHVLELAITAVEALAEITRSQNCRINQARPELNFFPWNVKS
jgi:hypothetical protein